MEKTLKVSQIKARTPVKDVFELNTLPRAELRGTFIAGFQVGHWFNSHENRKARKKTGVIRGE